jgi:hypothetical protein
MFVISLSEWNRFKRPWARGQFCPVLGRQRELVVVAIHNRHRRNHRKSVLVLLKGSCDGYVWSKGSSCTRARLCRRLVVAGQRAICRSGFRGTWSRHPPDVVSRGSIAGRSASDGRWSRLSPEVGRRDVRTASPRLEGTTARAPTDRNHRGYRRARMEASARGHGC